MRLYDLMAFKSIANEKKQLNPNNKFNLVDVLTTINKAIDDHIVVPTKEVFPHEKQNTLWVFYNDRCRLEGALNFYRLMIFKIFKHCFRINGVNQKDSGNSNGNIGSQLYVK